MDFDPMRDDDDAPNLDSPLEEDYGQHDDGRQGRGHAQISNYEVGSFGEGNTGNAGQTAVVIGKGVANAITPWTTLFFYPRNPPGRPWGKTVYVIPSEIFSVDPAHVVTIEDVFVEVQVTWGVDGSNQTRVFEATKWFRLPVIADRIEVNVRLRHRNGSAVSPFVTANVRGFMGPSVDAYPLVVQKWTDLALTVGGAALLSASAIRLLSVSVFRTTAVNVPLFALLFDSADVASVLLGVKAAVDGGPLPAVGGSVKFPYLNTRAFVNGCVLGISATAPAFTLPGGIAPLAENALFTFEEAL